MSRELRASSSRRARFRMAALAAGAGAAALALGFLLVPPVGAERGGSGGSAVPGEPGRVYEVRAAGGIRAGFGEADITPDWPVRLSYGRPDPTSDSYDRALVHVLLLEVGGTTVGLLEFDVIGIRRADAAVIKEEVARATGLDPRHLIVAATHNHSYARTHDETVRAFMAERAAEAAAQAQASLFEARIGVGKMRAREDLNLNRAELDGVANPLLYVLRVDDAAGHLRGMLFNYGSHATIFTEWSQVGQTGPDWPGYVRQYVQARKQLDLLYERYEEKNGIVARPFVMFAGGAAGDQQPRRADVMLRGEEAPPKKVFMEKLARDVLRLVDRVETTGQVELAFRSTTLELQRKNGRRHETLLQSMVLNDAVLATIPGELGVDLAYRFEAASPFAKNLLITNADDYLGYIVPEHLALEQVTYQAKGVSFEPHYGMRIIDAAVTLIDPDHRPAPALDPERLLGSISGTVHYDGANVIAIGVRRLPGLPNYGGGFWGRRTVADEEGRWRIDGLAPGTFYIYVAEADPGNPGPERKKSGYRDLRTLAYGHPVTVEPARETAQIHFRLPPDLLETAVTGLELERENVRLDGNTLSGRFAIAGALDPDEVVEVGLYSAEIPYRQLEVYLARPVIRTTAEADGSFRFESVPPGRYRIVGMLDVNRNRLVERRIDRMSRLADSPLVQVPEGRHVTELP